MALRKSLSALVALALLAGSAVLVSAAPASATVVSVTVTSNADLGGTCPSANNCTLRQALADSSNGGPNGGDDVVITIAQGLGTITLLNGVLTYDGGNSGTQALTINGNGATIDGNSASSLLQSGTSGLLSLNSLSFTRGFEMGFGGAVIATAALEIRDSTFSNNFASAFGGAVYTNTSLVASNVSFIDCSSNGAGGAIVASTADISFATFTGNTASVDGGAIFVYSNLTLTNSSFTGNTAAVGGAIESNNTMDVRRSLFSDNTAHSRGGAAFSSTGTFIDTEFSANTVNSGSGKGGAIFLSANSGSSLIEDSVFRFNSGPGGGGAVLSEHQLTLTRSAFHQNSAFNDTGGAVNVDGPVAVNDSSFTENLADIAGALSGTNLTINNSDFSENIAQIDIAAVYGNAIVINRSSFDGNEATRDFGAVNATGLLTVTQSSFTNNSAGRQIAVAQSNGVASFINTTIVGNSSRGPLILGFGDVQLKYSTVTENVVTTNQVSLVIFSGGVISLFGNVLTNSSPNVEICSGATSSSGYNYANDTSCGLNATGDNQNVSNDPMLGSLGDHGGITLTRLPLVGSPLINAIPNAACQTAGAPANDQRGYARPNVPGGGCDIGAVQLTPTVTATVSSRTVTVDISEFTSSATITLQSDPITLGTISVDSTGSGTATFDIDCSIPDGAHTITATASGGQSSAVAIELAACTPNDVIPDTPVIPVFTG